MRRGDSKISKADQTPAFVALVRRQLGAFTRQQTLAHGITDTVIARRLRSEAWLTVRRGVYVLTTSRRTWERQVMVTLLVAGGDAFASHRCAAFLWRLEGVHDKVIEVSTRRRTAPLPGAKFHRVVQPPAGDVQALGAIRIASPTRTLIELAADVDDDCLDVALDDALRRRLTSLPRINWRLDRVGARGMKGAARLREFLRQRDPTALPESALERRFLRFLEARSLPPPTSVQRVVADDGFVARADFAYETQRLLVEVDSFRFHSSRIAWEKDRARRNRLEGLGWRVLHVTAEQMRLRPEDIVTPLRSLLLR